MSQGRVHTFASLRDDVDFVEIPIIQRDYAQGRGEAADVRRGFLDALREALRPGGASLDLDFVYGSVTVDGVRRLAVLDGQQRLTTLFLLHWFLGAREGRLEDFRQCWGAGGRSRFTYATRPSATEFFDAIVREATLPSEGDVRRISQVMADARWFFASWSRDPTVASCLVVLDAIQSAFVAEPLGLYARLMEQSQISFHFLDLPAFGLSDDLYIRMNARGKALTPFENFKAWLVARCGNAPWAEAFATGLDQRWLDFFWDLAGRADSLDFGELFLKFFHLQAYFESCKALGHTRFVGIKDRAWLDVLRESRGYVPLRDFEDRNLLGTAELPALIPVLDFLSDPRQLAAREALVRALVPRAGYEEQLCLHAVASFVRSTADAALSDDSRAVSLRRWVRVTTNLVRNSRIDDPLAAAAMVRGLSDLSVHAADLCEHLVSEGVGQFGFAKEQTLEEVRKAALILQDPAWEAEIEHAEGHWYLQGRVGFLLDLAAAGSSSVDLGRFSRYAAAMRRVVTREALESRQHVFQRALLSLYDYLPSAGSNHTFCVALATSYRDRSENWLRVFQDPRFGSFLDAIGDEGPESLGRLIAESTATGWRGHVVQHPELIAFCGLRLVRQLGDDDVLLLSKSRPTGFFAEVYSLALHYSLRRSRAAGQFLDLEPCEYHKVYGDEWPAARVRVGQEFLLRRRHGEWQCASVDGESMPMPEALMRFVEGNSGAQSG